MDSVLSDLNFACEKISAVKSNTSSSVTKWVALALKSRVCLFEGTFRKYHTDLNLSSTAALWLQQSADAANEIMNGSLYSIYNTNNPAKDYRSLFISENPVSAEVIFARVYNDAQRVYHSATRFFSNFGQYQPSFVKRFINTYLNIDGSRFTDTPGYDTIQFQREVLGRDARLAQTIRTPGYKRSDGTETPPSLAAAAVSGYQILKFSMDNPVQDVTGQSFNSIPIFRYAEVLLNYAEAKAELGTFTATEWDRTIGLLRKRAGLSSTSMPTVMDSYMKGNYYPEITSIPLMEIRRERSIELAAEGFRYNDLKRWKKGDLLEKEKDGIYVPQEGELLDLNSDGKYDVAFVTNTPSNPVTGVYYFKINNVIAKLTDGTKGKLVYGLNMVRQYPNYKYYAPLPYNELLLNKNLVQNVGWDKP